MDTFLNCPRALLQVDMNHCLELFRLQDKNFRAEVLDPALYFDGFGPLGSFDYVSGFDIHTFFSKRVDDGSTSVLE